MPRTLNPADAAAILGCGEPHVRRLCNARRLRARYVGRVWMIDPESVEEYKQTRRPPGRPRKE